MIKKPRTLSEISKTAMRDPEYRKNLMELLIRNGVSKETEKKLREENKKRFKI